MYRKIFVCANIKLIMDNSDKYTLVRLDEIGSTNSYALEHISWFGNGTVIYTPFQRSGRGRCNRRWIGDNSGNVYMSVILKPEKADAYPFPNLTQYLSVIVSRFLKDEFNIQSSIKWPNDILADGRKISGILAEACTENNKLKAVILGLGLNVNMPEETLDLIDQKAVSISVLTHKNYDIDILADKLADCFFKDYNNFVERGFPYIKDEYIQKCNFLGKNIIVKELNDKKRYFAKSIDNDGLLAVIDEFNRERKIITGDVLC